MITTLRKTFKKTVAKPPKTSVQNQDKNNEDSGSMTVWIISMSFIAFACVGLSIDLLKNAWIDRAFESKAQVAAETATKEMNSFGSLHPETIDKFISEYTKGRSDIKQDLTKTRSDDPRGFEYAHNTIQGNVSVAEGFTYYGDETNSQKAASGALYKASKNSPANIPPSKCRTVAVRSPNGNIVEHVAPYLRMTLSDDRNLAHTDASRASWEWAPDIGLRPIPGNNYDPNGNYTTLSVTTVEVSANLILGFAKHPDPSSQRASATGDQSMQCQEYHSNVSSITFGSQEDITNRAKAENSTTGNSGSSSETKEIR